MPPTRTSVSRAATGNSLIYPRGVLTRSKRVTENVTVTAKRKAVQSPPKEKAVKRSALGDVTNATGQSNQVETKKLFKTLATAITKPGAKLERKEVTSKVVVKSSVPTRTVKDQRNPLKDRNAATVVKAVTKTEVLPATKKVGAAAPVPSRRSGRFTRRSLVNSSDENSLYVSALDDSSDSVLITAEITKKVSETVISAPKQATIAKPAEIAKPVHSAHPSRRVVPDGIEDFDALHWEDPNQVGNYAFDIFEYLKSREADFAIKDYIEDQVHLNKWMRSLLVDWMVEVQENFELNHETLYLAVKLVDMYLARTIVKKETLQLVGAASVFIASKFDERIPPLVEDLIYICDGAYTPTQLLKMEVNILKAIDYELGIPLSYRFQRRYARCAHIAMPQLTLARYILELSLMEYTFVSCSDSKLGAAALLLALKMQSISSWTPTLEYYSGYKLSDIKDIVIQLNDMLHKKPKNALMTVRTKYSHKVFFEVATLPLLNNEDLFKNDL